MAELDAGLAVLQPYVSAGGLATLKDEVDRELNGRAGDPVARRALVRLQTALRAVRQGYHRSPRAFVVDDVLDGVLEQARRLYAEGFLAAACVTAGAALEAHLHELHDRLPDDARADSDRASAVNDALRRANVYGKTEQKEVTAMLGRRNDAAHPTTAGHDVTATNPSVALDLIERVERWIARHPL